MSNPPSKKCNEDNEEEIKCARVLSWLKGHGINIADP